MKDMPMSTLNTLRAELTDADLDRRLVFATIDGPIGAGYHVTEFKLAQVQSIDCGARTANWQEAQMQILDGYGESHMTVAKFTAIADQTVNAIPALGDVPITIEFAPRNQGLHLYQIGAVQRTDTDLIVGLQDRQAACKPAASSSSGGSACC